MLLAFSFLEDLLDDLHDLEQLFIFHRLAHELNGSWCSFNRICVI
jgi:hypothetical protein